jgi:hypothetical protein
VASTGVGTDKESTVAAVLDSRRAFRSAVRFSGGTVDRRTDSTVDPAYKNGYRFLKIYIYIFFNEI